jgi:hypothetical protein
VRQAINRMQVFAGVLAVSGALVLGLGTSLAQAAQAPTPYTGSAFSVTASTATLTGSVNPQGQGTNYYFEYGTTSQYGSATPLEPGGNATQTERVSAAVGGLSAYTVYHYRIVTANPSGTAPGADRTFTTAKIPLSFALSVAQPDPYGSPLTVSGALSGTGNTGRAVVLQANPFPYLTGFKTVGNPELTDANGYFAFPGVGLLSNTQLRVATLEKAPTLSQVVMEQVAVRVTLHVHRGAPGFARFYGTVTPAQDLARVYFQLLRPGRSPRTLASVVVGGARFSHLVRIRRAGLYRAYVQVSTGALSSSQSRPLRIG